MSLLTSISKERCEHGAVSREWNTADLEHDHLNDDPGQGCAPRSRCLPHLITVLILPF